MATNIWNKNIQANIDDSEMSDVEFRIGNEDIGIQDFSGIRALFATQSDVLKRMLYGNMAESKSNNIVIIDDISPHTFDWFKKYCYGLNPRVTNDNIVNVLHFCDKYCMKELYDNYLNILLLTQLGDIRVLRKIFNNLNNKAMFHTMDSIIESYEFGKLTLTECRSLILSTDHEFPPLSPIYVSKILFDSTITLTLTQSIKWEFAQGYCRLASTIFSNQQKQKPKQSENIGKTNTILSDVNSTIKSDVTIRYVTGQNHDMECKDVADDDVAENIDSNVNVNNKNNNDNFSINDDVDSKTGNDQRWLVIMRQYFLKRFDFCKMENKFFTQNVYNVKGLLTKEEKLNILEAKMALSVTDGEYTFTSGKLKLKNIYPADPNWIENSQRQFDEIKKCVSNRTRVHVHVPYDAGIEIRHLIQKLNRLRPLKSGIKLAYQRERDIEDLTAQIMFEWIKYWCLQCIDSQVIIPQFIRKESIYKIFFQNLISQYYCDNGYFTKEEFEIALQSFTFTVKRMPKTK